MGIICCVLVSGILSVFSLYPAASEHHESSLATIADRCRQKDEEHQQVLHAIRSHDHAYLSEQGRLAAHIRNRYTGGITLLHVAVATLHASKKEPTLMIDTFAACDAFKYLWYTRAHVHNSTFYLLCAGQQIQESAITSCLSKPLIQGPTVSPLELAVSYNNMPIIIALSRHIDFFNRTLPFFLQQPDAWDVYPHAVKNSMVFWQAMIEHRKIVQKDGKMVLPFGFTRKFVQQLGIDALSCLRDCGFDISSNCSPDNWTLDDEIPIDIFNRYHPGRQAELVPLLPAAKPGIFHQVTQWFRSAL